MDLRSYIILPYWTCKVQAALKLLHKDGIDNETITAVGKNLKYSNVNTIYWNPQFVEWENFITKYVNDESEATFEIELSTSLLKCKKPSDINQMYARLHVTLENVGKIREIISSEMIVCEVTWRVRFDKKENILSATLIADEMDFKISSFYKVSGIFKLLNFDNNTEPSIMSFTHNYRRGSSQVEKTLLDMAVLESGTSPYVEDNRVNVLVEFKVDKPNSLWANEVNSLNIVQTTAAPTGSLFTEDTSDSNILIGLDAIAMSSPPN